MDKVKFGIIGYGRIGTRHAEQIANNPRAELAIVCDIKEDRAKEAAEKYNCKYVLDYKELLKEDIDVVNVCTPSGLHAEMSIEALKTKNVLCEKPMTLTLKEADKVIEAEKQSGKKFFLVKQNRYNPPIKLLKDVVYNNKIGKPTLVNCNVIWNRRKQYYDESDWRGTLKLDGGSLMTQCSHFLDLMIWIGGKVKSVYAKMANLTHPYIETEDTGFITITFENGAIGALQYTTTAYEKNMEGTMTVIGEKGNIKVGGEYLNTLEFWNVENMEQPKLEEGNEANDYGTYKGSMSNHDKVIANVVNVLLDGEEIATNSFQGRESMEVMQAAYISAIKKKEIILPLKDEDYDFDISRQEPFNR
jgi:UDP-N-acetyl-2-amino-2-deoxyglucuronate dehydrogenase